MSRYADILSSGRNSLKEAHIDDFQTDGWLLFEHVFGMNRASYFMRCSEENGDGWLEEEYFSLIKKRCERIPLQHITGCQAFMGFDFKVNEHTLIPRYDTEVLVTETLKAIEHIRTAERREAVPVRVLDMCTGSGCIAVSIARLASGVSVTAADISPEALCVARENAVRLGADSVEFVQSDLFENIDGAAKYDIIVSNPPYIRTADIEGLAEEVRLHDPPAALDGGEDGLHFYRNITAEAAHRLNAGGCLLYEIGCTQAAEVRHIMEESGFDDIETVKDLAGLDRVLTGRFYSRER